VSDPSSPWLTVKEACTVAKVGVKLLYREVKAGRLRAARIGDRRDIRIHRDWIDAWLAASAEPVEIRRRA
jgi:excisionase family DNA binding protein